MPSKKEELDPVGSEPEPRTRKPGEVRSRNGCVTCKQRRKKCDEDFRVRQNGAMSCTRCADRGITCEFSTNGTPSKLNRPSPYPTTSATSSSSHLGRIRNVRATSSSASNPAVQTAPLAATLDPTLSSWTSSHFPLQQQFPQQQTSSMTNPALLQSRQNASYNNQLGWMSQNPTSLNRSTLRYNRPNIWPPTTNGNAGVDLAAMQLAANISAQANPQQAADLTAFYNLLNSGATPGATASPAQAMQWNQGYSSMDNMMLDDFVNELMSLTGPLINNEGAATSVSAEATPANWASNSSPREPDQTSSSTHKASQDTSVPSRVQQASSADSVNRGGPTFSSPPAPISHPTKTSYRYRKLLDSDAIESLLSKYSPIYERFWHATLLMLSTKRRQAAIDYLMGVIRSNKACRASVVVVCLAYHELVQRVRKEALKTNTAPDSSALPSWTTLASDAFKTPTAVAAAAAAAAATAATAEDRSSMSQTVLAMFPETIPAPSDGEDEDEVDDSDDEVVTEADSEAKLAGSRASKRKASESRPITKHASNSGENDDSSRADTPKRRGNKKEASNAAKDASKRQRVRDYTVELWFDIAQVELQRSREELTFEQELCAVINLRWAALCFAGAERARQQTEELGMVIKRSGIDLEQMVEEEKKGSLVSVMLQTAVYTDILDTASERGKRTAVPLRNDDHGPAAASRLSKVSNGSGAVGNEDNVPFFGKVSLLSLELLKCFKMTSDLAADMWGPISSSDPNPSRPKEEEVNARSRDIEQRILCLPAWTDPAISSSLRVRAFALQEIWRQTARLYLLQAVHRRGALNPDLQAILHEIIRLTKMIKIQALPSHLPAAATQSFSKPSTSASSSSPTGAKPAPPNYVGGLRASDDRTAANVSAGAGAPPNYLSAFEGASSNVSSSSSSSSSSSDNENMDGDATLPFQMWLDVASWEMCTVWFLCSTIALTRADRQFCIHHLESLGLERANRDNIQIIRDFWSKQDSTGHTLDWFDFVKSSGRCVIFAF